MKVDILCCSIASPRTQPETDTEIRTADGRMRESGKDVDSESEDDIPPWMLEVDPVSLREEIKVRITSYSRL